MKPCIHCGAAIENDACTCDSCGKEQLPAVGLDRTYERVVDTEAVRREEEQEDLGYILLFDVPYCLFVIFGGLLMFDRGNT